MVLIIQAVLVIQALQIVLTIYVILPAADPVIQAIPALLNQAHVLPIILILHVTIVAGIQHILIQPAPARLAKPITLVLPVPPALLTALLMPVMGQVTLITDVFPVIPALLNQVIVPALILLRDLVILLPVMQHILTPELTPVQLII